MLTYDEFSEICTWAEEHKQYLHCDGDEIIDLDADFTLEITDPDIETMFILIWGKAIIDEEVEMDEEDVAI